MGSGQDINILSSEQQIVMDELFDDDIDIFLANEEQDLDKHASRGRNLWDENSIFKEKNEIIHSSTLVTSEKNHTISEAKQPKVKEQNSFSVISLNKKQKNRIAAKQSRDRKKLYLELMERKQKKVESQLLETQNQLRNMKAKVNTLLSQNKSVMGFRSYYQLQGKLQKILTDQELECEEEINVVLDSLRFRIGATGKERAIKLNECFRQIVNLSLPALHRYMMWIASEDTHLFSIKSQQNEEKDEFEKELIKALDFTKINKELMKKIKSPIEQRRSSLVSLIEKLKQIKIKFQNKGHEIEEEIDSLRDILIPSQVAKLTLNVNRNKFRKEINFLQLESEQGKKVRSMPSKRVKIEQN